MRKMITVTLEDRREGGDRRGVAARSNWYAPTGRRFPDARVHPSRNNPLGVEQRVGRRVNGERRRG